ncbi:serine hydrolase [Floccifex sp.]|uniref:serine hydrolase n=1 Tax=Floccifex sp. TaxID=2815810 RepID=UPI003F0AF1C5
MKKVTIVLVFILILLIGIESFFSYQFITYQPDKKEEKEILVEDIELEKEIIKDTRNEELKERIEIYLNENQVPLDGISIFVSSADNKVTYSLNEDEYFIAASLYKLPLAMIYYEKVYNKEINLEDTLTYEWTEYEQGGPIGDSYLVGSQIPLSELLRCVILYSDNTAGHILYENLGGWSEYKKCIEKYSPDSDFDDMYYSIENVTKASFMNDVLTYLYEHQEMFQDLLKNMKESMPNRYLDQSLQMNFAQKYGYNNPYSNAAGLYLDENKGYRITILTSLSGYGEKIIGDINQICFEFLVQ